MIDLHRLKIFSTIIEVKSFSKAARKLCLTQPTVSQHVNFLEEYLGVPKFRSSKAEINDKVGSVTGLAWTSVGGDILNVDATIMAGSEKLTLTGQLGNVMKESAQAALSYIRSNATSLGLAPNFQKGKEIHIHLPEGAIPKDGPSAGITLTMAIYSAFSGKSARGDVAMTGEITLRGNVLAIGGLNEKLIAAKRNGIKKVIIPKENEKDLTEIKSAVKDDLEIIPVEKIDEAMKHVFGDIEPYKEKPKTVKKDSSSKKEKEN